MKIVLLILVLSVSSIYYGNAMTCEEEGFLGLTRLVTCPRLTDRPTAKYCCGTDEHVVCCDNPLGIGEEDFQRLAKKPSILEKDILAEKLIKPKKIFKSLPIRIIKKRSSGNSTLPVVFNTLITKDTVTSNEGFRENIHNAKDKVNLKLNSTIENAKEKGKQKVKDMITKQVEKKLDPTGTMKLPAILGTIVAVIISLIVLCIVCCCCCPFCLIYKKRSRGAIHNPAPTVAQMQPQQSYVPVQTSYANQPYPPQPQPTYPPANQGYGMASQPGYGPPPSNAPYPISQPPYPTTPLNASNEQPPPYAEKQLPYNPNY